jgi:hypothetical protein
MAPYRAALSRTQNRAGWSVIFRHPALRDGRTGKPGKRVRYGLSTRDDALAVRLVSEIDQLLADERWWSVTALPVARDRFHPRVVEIFYDALEAEPLNARDVRDHLVALPEGSGYRKVLLLGTTGAGKTTLVRQLIGTDPDDERFPTTATGRTTIADMEIITAQGAFEAAVTFFPADEIREHLIDCMMRAVLAANRGEVRVEIQRALLQHPDQRFRFNYILGDGPAREASQVSTGLAWNLLPDDLSGEAGNSPRAAMPELGEINLDETTNKIDGIADRVIKIAEAHGEALAAELAPTTEADRRLVEELVEEELEERLRDDDEIHEMVDALIDEMHLRVDLIDIGTLVRNRQGWPESWTWATEDRVAFIRQLRRFTSNAKPGFGRLLTPLVSGIRIRGPFAPTWHDGKPPELILFDTEGLGHTPDSSSSIPTKLTRLIDEAHAVILVDNAEQPMQAAPAAAMRAMARTGHAAKLHLCFTHFDAMTGDNLPTEQDKALHVLSACNTVLSAIGKELGPFGERPLRSRVRDATYFLADAHKDLKGNRDRRAVYHLQRLLRDIAASGGQPTLATTRPVYEQVNLVVAIRDAVEDFQEHWAAVLGRTTSMAVTKEHWARIKALSRRFAHRIDDEYLHLRPVAQLQAELQGEIFKLIQNPVDWSHGQPSEDEQQALYDDFANRLSRRLLELAKRRVSDERHREWQEAFVQRGRGSTVVRARIIAEDIYGQAAPVPRSAPSANANALLHEVINDVRASAGELGARLR